MYSLDHYTHFFLSKMINVSDELAMEVLHARIEDGAFQGIPAHMVGFMSKFSICTQRHVRLTGKI